MKPTPDLSTQNIHFNKIFLAHEVKRSSSKQLDKLEDLFLFLLKTVLKPRMIFTFFKLLLKIFFPLQRQFGATKPKIFLR